MSERRTLSILTCTCGNELETDVPQATLDVNKGKRFNCGQCGKFEWTKAKSVGKKISKDATAPLELIKELEDAE
jgi:hypothetical protein